MTHDLLGTRSLAVIGAGAWGTTLARLLSDKGLAVRLWAHEPEVAESIRTKRENTLFLPGVALPPDLLSTHSLNEAVSEIGWYLVAVPSHAARSVLVQLAPLIQEPRPVVIATKGIEEDSLLLMSEVVRQTLGSGVHAGLAVLSGPSFAAEVCAQLPTAVTLASHDQALLKTLQTLIMTPAFRVYTSGDPIGVQLGGALKNVMALAAGIVDGLGLGHNARAALITRGLAEMIRLGTALGADPRTFYGLSGVGDLVLTCTGRLSRNYSVGQAVATGRPLDEVTTGMRGIAEGVRTSRAALGLAERHGVEMPIVQAVCDVLFHGKSCRQAVAELMERTAKDESAGPANRM
jgi:glycerol-3-phosphate dehydrogenase (NAD(P)+)